MGGAASGLADDQRRRRGSGSQLAAPPVSAADPPAQAERGAGDGRAGAALDHESPSRRLSAPHKPAHGARGGEPGGSAVSGVAIASAERALPPRTYPPRNLLGGSDGAKL